MGLALLAIIWLITFVSTYFFAAKTWWLPHGASTSARWIDHQFAITYLLMGVVFVAAQGALGLFVWQYRDQGKAAKADYSHGNIKLEVIWTTLTAALFIGLNLMGSPIWAATLRTRASRFGSCRSYRHAVRLVFSLCGPGRQVWRYCSQVDGSLGW